MLRKDSALRSVARIRVGGEQSEPGRERKESKMPKLKTKSGAKKRFKMTGTGKIKAQAQGKRHGMIKRHAKFIRQARGTMVLDESDAKIVKKYMPYAR
jgi:large subunit ribosomal protein L35